MFRKDRGRKLSRPRATIAFRFKAVETVQLLRLSASVDDDKVDASSDKGVLKVSSEAIGKPCDG